MEHLQTTADGTPWIDPILLRPEEEKWSFRTALFNTFTSSDICSNNVPKSEMLDGGDVSLWQGEMDWNQYFDNGMRFVFIRAMINGYADAQFDRNANILTQQNRWFGVYGATGYPTLSNALPYARKLADLVDGVGNLSVWWDSEVSGMLNSSEMAVYNSEVMGELSVLLPGRILEIYTRQSFWDSSVQAGNWSKYPLAAARYSSQLTCPWSDGNYQFRDWDAWRYWQDSSSWDGKKYGAESSNIDHDYFNGNEEMFKTVYSLGETIPDPTCCEKLEDEILALSTEIYELRTEFENHTHEESPVDPEPPPDTVIVRITEQHKSHYFKNTDDAGKPIMLTDDSKEPLYEGDLYHCQNPLSLHSGDNPSSPTTIASGGRKFFRIISEGTYKGRFIRKDKSIRL